MKQAMIRSLVGEDPENVLKLWRESGLPHRPKGRDLPAALGKEFAANEDLALGAYLDAELVGTVLATDDGRKGWINRLAVAPPHRRKGIGSLLLRKAEDALHGRGRRIVAALVENWNVDSVAFFQAKGYRLHEDIQYLSKREGAEV